MFRDITYIVNDIVDKKLSIDNFVVIFVFFFQNKKIYEFN